ncbi:dual specificity protein kinase CLK2-like [Argiope bruennichi]|uniref:Serine/threonine-protein kinase Doa like protein n=1 Tax=Argiope bruennichi TaxID=94029 RepID=A0A8T0F0B5_ARGBR|nr:dual specificity protein kinase CLK2-like [Argiope bruennichi]XP_055926508.1 dual specificity protein kinase CLK2-like [Argiope bruennichi]KAF8784574.1 Serine/threonine-protein kinase Doa like protein [Argiope bruennichi]
MSSDPDNLAGPSKESRNFSVKKSHIRFEPTFCSKRTAMKARKISRVNVPFSNVIRFDNMPSHHDPHLGSSVEIRAPSVKKAHILFDKTFSANRAAAKGISGFNIPFPNIIIPENASSDSDSLAGSSEESRTPSVNEPHNRFESAFCSKRTAAKGRRIPRFNRFPTLIQVRQMQMESEDQVYTDDDDGHLNLGIGDNVENYTMVGHIGKGTFGRVIKARSLDTRQIVALKIVRNSLECIENAKNEVTILKSLNEKDPEGKYLWVQMVDFFEFQDHVCIAFEKLGESLYSFMKINKHRPYQLSQVRHIIYQICYSVKALHDNMIMHTDLKPENICFQSSDFTYGVRATRQQTYRKPLSTNIRLIDFGSAIHFTESRDMMIQTRYYRAPEVIFGLPWDQAVDVWSIGCILFELYTGDCLFAVHDNAEHFIMMHDVLGAFPHLFSSTDFAKRHEFLLYLGRRKKGRKPLKRYMHMSSKEHQELFDLMEKLLKYDPKERIRLTDALQHPFFDLLPDHLKLE